MFGQAGPEMQIVFHIGANCTDGDRLVRSLVKNSDTLARQGVCIPPITRYRKLLRETIQSLAGSTPASDTRDSLLDEILREAKAERLVMSNSTFICLPPRVFEGGQFYGLLEMKIRALTLLFPNDDIELFLALRNPATFIPAVFEQARTKNFGAFMDGVDPTSLRWSEVVSRIRAIAPTAKLTVWCNEDTPLIWSDVLKQMIGDAAPERPIGEFDLLATIMSPEGMSRFQAYLATRPPKTNLQMRRVIAAFLDKYALPDAVEEEVDLPGWDAQLVDHLTHIYEDDVKLIAGLDGLTFLEP
nr:hypothetical protein [Flavimaricola sp.]